MRIITKFKDYYDSVLVHGMDTSLIYTRYTCEERETEWKEKYPDLKRLLYTMPSPPYSDTKFLILFCGKVYPGWELLNGKIIYSAEEWLTEIQKQLKIKDRISHWDMPDIKSNLRTIAAIKKGNGSKHPDLWLTPRSEKRWREAHKAELAAHTQVLQDHEAPVAILERCTYYHEDLNPEKIVINPRLSDYNFGCIVTPYSAFQEISMFLGGVLATNPDPIPVISDDTMRDSKGFTPESFRSVAPGQKKLNRKRNKLRKKKDRAV